MQLSGPQSLSNTLRLSLTSESQRNALLGRLSEGQTIQARVVDELSTGRWAVRFMGHTLVAESRLNLRPGQSVEARVQDLGPPLVLSLSGRLGSETAAVRSALTRLGLADDATNRAVIAALIRNGLPVERGELQALRDFLAGLEGNALLNDLDELVDRILFLRGKGIAVTPGTLTAFWSAAPAGALGALIEGLADLLRSLDRRVPERTRDALAGVLADFNRQGGHIDPESLRGALAHVGIDLEGRLADGRPIDSLKAVLLQLSVEPGLRGAERDQVADLLRFLNTVQAASLPGRDADPIAFQIPFCDAGAWSAADIRISRRGQDGAVDPARVTLTVTVTLSVLGRIRIDLSSYEGRNTCAVRLDNQAAHDLLAPDLESLEDGLARAGYPVPDIQLRVESAAAPEAPKPRLGVDFKA